MDWDFGPFYVSSFLLCSVWIYVIAIGFWPSFFHVTVLPESREIDSSAGNLNCHRQLYNLISSIRLPLAV